MIDLDRGWVVPPFAEAHNHNISNGAAEESDQQSIRRYVADGVFYVKIPGNVPPSPRTDRLAINRPNAIDVAFGHGSLTSTSGHPIALVNGLAARGLFRGHTPESLRDLRYFTIDSAADLERNWPLIASHRADFIKVILVWSEEHESAAGNDAAAVRVAGRTALKGLNPRLLPAVVAKVHASNLRVSAHVNTAADLHFAVSAGVDEIVHLPPRRAATIDLSGTADWCVARRVRGELPGARWRSADEFRERSAHHLPRQARARDHAMTLGLRRRNGRSLSRPRHEAAVQEGDSGHPGYFTTS